ncbi:MAG: hypothetical protein R2698_03140 [Microthrixaceae bacterium]
MDEYPVKLGAMLYTLVDPHRGHEVAYNRWYERDHFYGGCMIGPGILAGARWVATRPHKDLRFPVDSPVTSPVDAGSYLATYFVQRGHEREHFAWASPQVFELYRDGRGFEERDHAHTVLYTHRRAIYRDPDGVPVEVALDHRYGGLVSLHVDRTTGTEHADLDDWFDRTAANALLAPGSAVAIVSSWRPIIPREGQGEAPMKLGSGPGTPQRSLYLFFCEVDPATIWPGFIELGAAIEDSGLAVVALAAPFVPTIPGTDTYTDRLW